VTNATAAFRERFEARHERARATRQRGKKIVACFYGLAPKELVHASGMVPVQLVEDRDSRYEAKSSLPPYMCGMSKNLAGQLASRVLDYDGVMVSTVCDTNRHMLDIWVYQRAFPNHWLVRTPAKNDEGAVDYFTKELRRLAGELGRVSGQPATDEGLCESIALFNENRALFRRFYELRSTSGISAEDAVYVFASALTTPVEEHNALLRQLLASLPPAQPQSGPRLMLSALSIPMSLDLIRTVEKFGATVVTDDFIRNARYGCADVPTDGDPFRALARGYLRTVPAPGMYPVEDRANGIRDAMSGAGAEGLIYLVQLYCDAYAFEYAVLKERFERWKLPHLKLEAEATPGSIEHLNVRIQSFIESLV
jgi:benzoyl-CoA reductase/2-hydroxyglutaryl-CoA dehydratase subunit BcrC/BadD/HgdB